MEHSEEFEKWWLSQCTKGYFIHYYENDKEAMQAAWESGAESERMRTANLTYEDGKLVAYRDAIGILTYCDETTKEWEETFDKSLSTLNEREEQLVDFIKNM